MEVSALAGVSVEKLFLTVGELTSFEEVFFSRSVAEFLVVSVHLYHSYGVKRFVITCAASQSFIIRIRDAWTRGNGFPSLPASLPKLQEKPLVVFCCTSFENPIGCCLSLDSVCCLITDSLLTGSLRAPRVCSDVGEAAVMAPHFVNDPFDPGDRWLVLERFFKIFQERILPD